MITAQANYFVRRPFLEINQEIDDAPAVRATVDVVTKKYEGRLLRAASISQSSMSR